MTRIVPPLIYILTKVGLGMSEAGPGTGTVTYTSYKYYKI